MDQIKNHLYLQGNFNSESLELFECRSHFYISQNYSIAIICKVNHEHTQRSILNELMHSFIQLRLESIDQPICYISGLVTDITRHQKEQHYVITLQSALSQLKREPSYHIYNNQSYLDIIKKILDNISSEANHHFKIDYSGINRRYTRLPTITQYNESNNDFLHRISYEAGINYYFTFNKDAHTIHFYNDQALLNAYPDTITTTIINDTQQPHMAQTSNYDIFTGFRIKLNNKKQTNKYLVTQSFLQISPTTSRNLLHLIHAETNYQRQNTLDKPKIYTTQKAHVITDGNQPYHVDRFGSIKIQFHWDNGDHIATSHQAYAKVKQSNNGYNWGALWMPQLGENVLVQFEEGDINKPVIIQSADHNSLAPAFEKPRNQFSPYFKALTEEAARKQSIRERFLEINTSK